MSKSIKVRLFILGILLLIGIVVVIVLNNIPITSIVKPLQNPEQINNIYIEIDRGAKTDGESFWIEDSATINMIVDQLLNVKLAYRGMYSGISYGTYDGDWIIVMHINGRDNDIRIKQNGELYTTDSKYISKDNNIEVLFHLILKNLPLKE